MERIIYLISIIVPFFIASCNRQSSVRTNDEGGDTLHLEYAKNIIIVKYTTHYDVTMLNPWKKGKILHRYRLAVAKDAPQADDMTTLKVPLENCLISTSVHCELAKMLGKEHCVGGICDLQYMNSPWIKKRCSENKTQDCGSSMAPNIEKIITLSPDAIFLSPMNNTGGYGKVESIGIPIIELADYMEPTALGRAEWIKFYGILLGAEKQAKKIFDTTEKQYKRLTEIAAKSANRPTVLMDKIENGVWYVPGGKSTMAQELKDAGMKYAYSTNDEAGSLQLSPEKILDNNADADIWVMRYYKADKTPLTLDELEKENTVYPMIKALKEKNVYGCNTAASTFFEDIPFRPDLLLRDFIIIANPDKKELGKTKYFKKLN